MTYDELLDFLSLYKKHDVSGNALISIVDVKNPEIPLEIKGIVNTGTSLQIQIGSVEESN